MNYVINTEPIKKYCEYHRLTLKQFMKLCGISAENFIDFLDNEFDMTVINKMRNVLGENSNIIKRVD